MFAFRLALGSLIAAACANAQPSPPEVPNAVISGVVREAGTGRPLAGLVVRRMQPGGDPKREATTDQDGHFRLDNLAPGIHNLAVHDPKSPLAIDPPRQVSLAGQDVDIVIRRQGRGVITGTVFGEDRKPVARALVQLASKEYYRGTLETFLRYSAWTDREGKFRFDVLAGEPLFLFAEGRGQKLDTHAPQPDATPGKRTPSFADTWYPNAKVSASAVPLTVGPGQTVEAINVELRKAAPLCVAGITRTQDGPAALRLTLHRREPGSGISRSGGMFTIMPGDPTGPGGEFRICGLSPGGYRLVSQNSATEEHPALFGETSFDVEDQDLHDITLSVSPGVSVDGEVVLADPPSTELPTVEARLVFEPLHRPALEPFGLHIPVPGNFRFHTLMNDEYALQRIEFPPPKPGTPRYYLQDAVSGAVSIVNRRLHPATDLNGKVTLLIGRDGASAQVLVRDKEGKPVPDANITLFPASVRQYPELADTMITGRTDNDGRYATGVLAPGKYRIAATWVRFDATVQSLNQLWNSTGRFQDIELAPNQDKQLTLEVTDVAPLFRNYPHPAPHESLTESIAGQPGNKKPLLLQHHQVGDSGACYDYVLPKAHNHVHYPWHQRVAEEGRL